MRRRVAVSCLVLLIAGGASLAGCAEDVRPSQPAKAPSIGTSAPPFLKPVEALVIPAPRDDGRLPALATPLRYSLALDVDPAQPRFHGTVTILVDVAGPTRALVMHGRDLHVAHAAAKVGERAIEAQTTTRLAHGGLAPEELVLTFAETLPAGRATITIEYDAPFSPGLDGLYRVQEGGAWYAFTQFESTDARRAFPCFDEPAYKAAFDLSITAPRGMIAVANAPELARTDAGDRTRFAFATTPPISTYLMAFAVGTLDVLEGKPSASGTPIRLISTRGKAKRGDGALEIARASVDRLADYFGVNYPFAKLDLVAVPNFAAGAMENPGLVTFREEKLLQDWTHVSALVERNAAETIAHELAHIWFGDLVTMQWWNDVWLNEGFATWMETKILESYRPDLHAADEAVLSREEAMEVDGLASARAVRQPVSTSSEIEEAFDFITYEKGAAVLGMIEQWIGEEAFKRGVRDYMSAHAWKNATATDLLSALDRASGRNVTGMAATFLDRAGVPNVHVTKACDRSTLKFDLAQSPWRPLGVRAKAMAPWTVPVCIGAPSTHACTDLAANTGSFERPTSACPAWAYPNVGKGYYRFSLNEADARALAKNAPLLGTADRIGLVLNLDAEVRGGELAPGAMLDALPSFDRESEGNVVKAVIDALSDFDDALVDDAARPAFRAYATARLAPHLRDLGWAPKKNGGAQEADRAITRAEVIAGMGQIAHDKATIDRARTMARAWLADPTKVDEDVAMASMRVASIGAGAEWFETLRAAAKSAKTAQDRTTILGGMGGFDDPAVLKKIFDWALTDEVKMQDTRYIFSRWGGGRGIFQRPEASKVLFAWMRDHWDALVAKMPGPLVERFVQMARSTCDAKERDERRAFFEPRVATVEGAPRVLAESLEIAGACVELHAHGAADVTKYFATHRTR